MTIFCSECGEQQHTDRAKFCFSCGQALATGGIVSQPHPEEDFEEEEQEKAIWEGESKETKNSLSDTHFTVWSYRLTNRMLYLERGLFTTTSQQIPLWAVNSTETRQTLAHKLHKWIAFPGLKEESQEPPEDVGDIVVQLEHPEYTGDESVTLRFVERHTEVRRLLNEASRKERRAYDRRHRTHYYGRER